MSTFHSTIFSLLQINFVKWSWLGRQWILQDIQIYVCAEREHSEFTGRWNSNQPP